MIESENLFRKGKLNFNSLIGAITMAVVLWVGASVLRLTDKMTRFETISEMKADQLNRIESEMSRQRDQINGLQLDVARLKPAINNSK